MDIIHNISASFDIAMQRDLVALGISVDIGFDSFQIKESHPSWHAVKLLVVNRKWPDIVTTKFSSEELSAASYLELIPAWHCGYPQPKSGDRGYLKVTYDTSELCPQCGIGARQRNHFRMNREPQWGVRSICQLNWIFDEFFVTPQLWSDVFQPKGVLCRSVLNAKGDRALETVVQLVVTERVDVVLDDYPCSRCEECSAVKYTPIVRGMSPALVTTPVNHVVQSNAWFGSGARAFRSIMISQAIYGSMQKMLAKGVTFKPTRNG